jgi:peroxiredoxin
MKRLLAFIALAAPLLVVPAFSVQLPRKAPEFAIQMADGPQQLLSTYRGKVVAMAFMYTTCSHCQHTAGVLAKVQTEYAAKGVQVLGVTFDQGSAFRVKQFIKDYGVNFPCGFSSEGSVKEFLQIPATDPYFVPILVFIDKTGNIRSEYIGDENFLNKQEVNIRAELDNLLKSGPASSAAAKKTPKS